MDVQSCTSGADTVPVNNTSTNNNNTSTPATHKPMKNYSQNSHSSNRSSSQPQQQQRLPSISNIPPVPPQSQFVQHYSHSSSNGNSNANASGNANGIYKSNGHSHHTSHHSHYTSSIPTVTTTMKSMTYYQSILHPPPISFPLQATTTLLLGITTEYWWDQTNVYLVDVNYLINWLTWCLHQSTNTTIVHSTHNTAGTTNSHTDTNDEGNTTWNGSTSNSHHHHHQEHQRLQDCVRTIALQYQLPIIPTIGMPYTNPGPINNAPLSYSPQYPFLLFHNDTDPDIHDHKNPNDNQDEPSDRASLLRVYQPCVDPYAATSAILVHRNGTTMMSSSTGSTSTSSNMHRDASVRSLPDDLHQQQTSGSKENEERSCMALPESFYELIRNIHGVCCDDNHTISFQSSSIPPLRVANGKSNHALYTPSEDDDIILHHHVYRSCPELSPGPPPPRPIEFRRKIIYQVGVLGKSSSSNNANTPSQPQQQQLQSTKASKKQLPTMSLTTSLMDKLLLEQQVEQKYLMVEVHPIKLYYSYYDEDGPSTTNDTLYQPQRSGFVYVSRDTPAIHVFVALQQLTAPHKAKQCVRLWSQRTYHSRNSSSSSSNNNNGNEGSGPNHVGSFRNPTHVYDGYELIDMDQLTDEQAIPLQQQLAIEMGNHSANGQTSPHHLLVTIGSYVERHHITPNTNELDILVETRRTVETVWPRMRYELSVRIQKGDYVDAQDVTGQWYEAIVREVQDNDNTVLVHYTGWATRWDTKIRRSTTDPTLLDLPPLSPSVPTRVKAPAPLWSQSGRWRERLKVGDMVEVRDSSSLVDRPKWYKGIVQYIGGKNEKPRVLTGGADIELYDVIDPSNPHSIETTPRQPLLLLNRTQQILVEVEQERIAKAGSNNNNNNAIPLLTSASSVSDSLAPNPPYVRWVNLFGEEICKIGTHLNEAKDDKPVTLRYEYDTNRKPVAVMKSHPTLGSGFVRESLRGTPPAPGSVGLHNLGNSCFLNSTLQCLNHISLLTQFFVQDKYSKDLNRRNPLGSGGNVAVAYASLLKQIWAGEHSVLVPRVLKQTVANFAPQFDNSYQHDSHEFCQFLMDGLHEDLNRVKTKPYVEELEGFGMDDDKAAIESWKKHLLRHDSVIVDHCQGMHRSHLTCPQCGRESIKFDVYSSISLPLPTDKNKGTIRLEDCIEKFMEAEQLDDRDAYYCPNCRRHVCALKLIALWTIPDVLILHLKRFTFDTCMSSGSMLRSKVDNKVEFPINNLDLTKIVLGPKDPSAPPIYNLYGVSEHIGATANSGHYTATVRNCIDGQWYRCNDSHVGLTSGEASITGGAYLLFYQRAKGSTRWGGMYRAMKDLNIDPYGISEPIDKEGFQQVKLKKKKKP